MTDEEKSDLQKLSKDELIELLDGLRDDAAKQREAEKKAIFERFYHGNSAAERADEEGVEDVFDLSHNDAFQGLKKKFNR